MLLGFVGLGAVVETAYLPAIRNLFPDTPRCLGFDVHPEKQPEGVTRCASLGELLSHPLDTLFITTSSLYHLEVLEQALASPASRIVVEKPIVATLPQIEKLKALLAQPGAADRVLALDHWMARLDSVKQSLVAHVSDIVKIEGFLQEPSGYNAEGEPIALNFATGEPDARTLRHPDGVILDIGTHVLAMLRETMLYLGGSDDMTLQVVTAKDRLGREIATGDLTTAEGEAHLQGSISGVPVDIWLNKYAGPAGGQKGLRFHLRDGRIVSHDRRGAEDVLELIKGKEIQRWHIPGTIYEHCLAEHILGAKSLFERDPHQVSRTTRRRVEEVTLLLTLQQQLRGPH
ncbi:Predicted dehydrogenases and related proteins [Enterobacter hormaechei]|uniref:Gfo/Idh/MocA family oxidoreductase n=1 Tax=Enterobacter TaxID=547 RepID=UPI0005ED806B|nr:Gfo/Idh/MocA family oxidoreductase [Enterobacter hormaechei]HCJ7328969.1 Gfo/Idh/MocA family oxidoreductase [Enterobacter hormaechei subsp. xiangfangensis]ASQ77985.1 oxidoreductase [Enterobacter hormaechei]ELD3407679.1 Gfo/Idh/MocA family oxidoreductase [Enterobacter hormaechei]KJO66907.1 oxidoreductase [Enterobacter hormaechei subsp. steigerwaltii]MCO6028199.1 Gfo/Idh/MocA family oxidoreductase [Enterobacter hormaechei]